MNFAVVTFIIKNDSYISGALTLAYSLKKQNIKADLICFVTKDITNQGVKALEVLYDKVIKVEQIVVDNKRIHSRQDAKELFNRFKALLLEDEKVAGKRYHKILLADCDALAINNWNELFKLETPVGIINESKNHTMEYDENKKYTIPKNLDKTKKWIWHKIYKDYPHGTLLPKEITDRVLIDNNNMGINTGITLLTPSLKLYNSIQKDLEDPKMLEKIKNFNWPEMQYITAKLSGKWHNMDIKYLSISGYPSLEYVYGIHYVGLKPWSFNNKSLKNFARFDDFKLWYAVYKKMLSDYPTLMQNKRLKNLLNKINTLQQNPKYLLNKVYPNIKHLI